jgi:hypothetical protein
MFNQDKNRVHLPHSFASDWFILQVHKHCAAIDCRAFPTCNLKRSSSRSSYAETGYFCSWKRFGACGYSKESRYLCSPHLRRNSISVASDGSLHKTVLHSSLSGVRHSYWRLAKNASVKQPSAKQSCLMQPLHSIITPGCTFKHVVAYMSDLVSRTLVAFLHSFSTSPSPGSGTSSPDQLPVVGPVFGKNSVFACCLLIFIQCCKSTPV